MGIRLPVPVFVALLIIMVGGITGAFVYGLFTAKSGRFSNEIFILEEAFQQIQEQMPFAIRYGYVATDLEDPVTVRDETQIYPGLTLITTVNKDFETVIHIVNDEGERVHEWAADWYKIWPDADHIEDAKKPKKRPAAFLHGAQVLPDHSVMFNFEYLGMVRLDACSNTMWRLPHRAHHSLMPDGNGNFWAGGRNWLSAEDGKRYPHLITPRLVETLILVSPEGELLEEIPIVDLLDDNDLIGLMLLSPIRNRNFTLDANVDILHLNDIEVFPEDMTPGVFGPGDIMLSLRNINTVLVFNRETMRVKYMRTGSFVRQHDPDFVDGNTISIYDNHNIGPVDGEKEIFTRILTLDAGTGEQSIRFPREGDAGFYSRALGKHQVLPNGNVLIIEPREGRAFEINNDNDVVWEYISLTEPGKMTGAITEASRLPTEFTAESFAAARQSCAATTSGAQP